VRFTEYFGLAQGLNSEIGVYKYILFYIQFRINGGELFERVVADDFTLTEFDCVGFMRQICDGVRFMHQKNIIHLDLKVGLLYSSTI